MNIQRIWSMPSKNTFSIKPIKSLLDQEVTEGLWIDPFANDNKVATITNDLNNDYDTDYHMDALDFLRTFDDCSVDGVLYDPPYSPRQVSECYKGFGMEVTMKLLKFRVWDIGNKRMYRMTDDRLDKFFNKLSFPLYWARIMQYLGINDINGTPMFEGDIVKLPKVDNGNGDVATFEFNAPNYYLRGSKGVYEISSKHNPSSYEVIGNIHEGVDGKPWI